MSTGQTGGESTDHRGYFAPAEAVEQFRSLGYVRLDGLLRPHEKRLSTAFEELFARGPRRGQEGRLGVPRAGSKHPLLRSLLGQLIEPVTGQIVGKPVTYLGGDAVIYAGDSYWHRDGDHRAAVIVKAVTYLEPLDATSGALRVLPGTHGKETDWMGQLPWLEEPGKYLGAAADELPSVVIPTQPGDVILFDTHILHSAFHGGERRRQITWTFATAPENPLAQQEISHYVLADQGVV